MTQTIKQNTAFTAKDTKSTSPFFKGSVVHPKLTINAPNDRYEQQANTMADRVMRMEEEEEMMQTMPQDGSIQRMCADCAEEEESLQTMPLMRSSASEGGYEASPELSEQLNQSKGGGASLPEATQARMSRSFGTDFSGVKVHTGSQAAAMNQSIQAKAFTHGSDIYFNEGQYQPGSSSGDHLLAHELTHVVQQGGNIQAKSKNPIQRSLLGGLLGGGIGLLAGGGIGAGIGYAIGGGTGALVGGIIGGVAGAVGGGFLGHHLSERRKETQSEESQQDPVAQRLALLYHYLDIIQSQKARQTRTSSLNQQLLAERTRLDEESSDPAAAMGLKERTEESQIETLNRRPLNIELTESAINFHIRFHVRFEGRRLEEVGADFQTLQENFRRGVELVWNQDLDPLMPLAGKQFRIIPTFTLIDNQTPRNQDFWLITVRPGNTGPITHDGSPVGGGEGVGNFPTSATDPMLDSGVMSIPPAHINRPGILGHELLHLFGLLDRYMALTFHDAAGQPTGLRLDPTRSPSPERTDPLGGQDGTILREDLNFIFHHFGVYEMEAQREEREATIQVNGMGEAQIIAEIHRLESGERSESLIRPRENFNDKIIESANDL
ncbi:MAG TPA: DUF4157 domain-containing protein [Saprospiraceae bacterium]|nr:DUF4157 domain-containing protein [Saprospiraceae bacterium]HMQ82154.1 DUF4157 domain-containing protein [Saprospiraceae bacterium]